MSKVVRIAKGAAVEAPNRFFSVLDFDHLQLEECLALAVSFEFLGEKTASER